MKLQDGNKTIELSVLGYQFPDEPPSKPNVPNHDANWLTIQVTYREDGREESYQDSCLLTWELSQLTNAMAAAIDGRITSYISDILEPYLKFALAKAEDRFTVQMQYSDCDPKGENWKVLSVTQLVSREQLSVFCEELKKVLSIYPAR